MWTKVFLRVTHLENIFMVNTTMNDINWQIYNILGISRNQNLTYGENCAKTSNFWETKFISAFLETKLVFQYFHGKAQWCAGFFNGKPAPLRLAPFYCIVQFYIYTFGNLKMLNYKNTLICIIKYFHVAQPHETSITDRRPMNLKSFFFWVSLLADYWKLNVSINFFVIASNQIKTL